VLTSFIAARTMSSGSPAELAFGHRLRAPPSRITAVLTGAPVPFGRRPSARPAFRSLRARLRHEVPGFGGVLIARPARVMDRGAGLSADRRSGSRAGCRWRDSRRPWSLLAAKPWIAFTSGVVASIVKGRSPHSVPSRSILRDRGCRSVPFSPSRVPRRAWGARSARGFASGTRCAAAELGGNRVGAHRDLRDRPGGSGPRRCRASSAAAAPGSPVCVHHTYKGARRLQTVTPRTGRIRGAFGECRSGGVAKAQLHGESFLCRPGAGIRKEDGTTGPDVTAGQRFSARWPTDRAGGADLDQPGCRSRRPCRPRS
jgi:hypothetical protein